MRLMFSIKQTKDHLVSQLIDKKGKMLRFTFLTSIHEVIDNMFGRNTSENFIYNSCTYSSHEQIPVRTTN